MMKCVDCELHDYVVGTHFCNHKGKSGRRKPRRISEEDAHKDVPCEFIEEMKGTDEGELSDDDVKKLKKQIGQIIELKAVIDMQKHFGIKREPTLSEMCKLEPHIVGKQADAIIIDESQTDIEIARAIVHKMIDDAVIAEDAYPDLRQKMHDAVDNYEPQTERPCDNCQEWDCYGCDYKQTERDEKCRL